ncbi:hypothetical protein CDAR_613321 [Caerostris darwini]|uniref:Uncharacterized protein n=1 Tax=Caerostris darwini TaxID=1538125 RepID=A0AAV4UTE1_9ARAC|nr:hypothetical protein CDAR_613321 [Caerostris darwini]
MNSGSESDTYAERAGKQSLILKRRFKGNIYCQQPAAATAFHAFCCALCSLITGTGKLRQRLVFKDLPENRSISLINYERGASGVPTATSKTLSGTLNSDYLSVQNESAGEISDGPENNETAWKERLNLESVFLMMNSGSESDTYAKECLLKIIRAP